MIHFISLNSLADCGHSALRTKDEDENENSRREGVPATTSMTDEQQIEAKAEGQVAVGKEGGSVSGYWLIETLGIEQV